MGKKVDQLQQDILNNLLSDRDAARRGGCGSNISDKDLGAWITSKEQFDELYKSVDEIEKFLRS
ncbi:MAG: hypothetical protein R3C14_40415 [Caldilineaceae bacterium]